MPSDKGAITRNKKRTHARAAHPNLGAIEHAQHALFKLVDDSELTQARRQRHGRVSEYRNVAAADAADATQTSGTISSTDRRETRGGGGVVRMTPDGGGTGGANSWPLAPAA